MSSAGISFTGLSTGLDTNNIVAQLMSIERRPVTKLQSNKATVQTTMDRLRALNTKLLALQGSAKNLMGTSANLSPFTAKKATSSDATKFTASVNSNTAAPGTYSVDVDALATSQRQGGGVFNAAQPGGTLTIGGVGVGITAGDTVDQVASKINAAGTTMNATVVGGRLVLAGKATGAANNSAISAGGGLSLADLGLDVGAVAATDAQIKVGGITITSANNTFTNALTGVDITAVAVGAGQSVTVDSDSSQAVDKMKDLVAKYNEIVTQVREDTKYDVASKKAGPLNGDPFANSLLTDMAKMITDSVNPSGAAGYQNYTDLGLSIQRDGSITLDETKFKAKLAENPNEVYKLMANEDGAMNGSTKINQGGKTGVYGDGLANRLQAFADQVTSNSSLYNDVNPSGGRFKGNLALRLEFSEARIKTFDTQIAAYEVRLTKREEFLKKQFLAMEKSVSQLRSQGNYLSGQFASTGG